jgi:hypothetical protein
VIRVVAIVAAYNEERFLGSMIEHYRRNDVGVYLIDNESTDRTPEIARSYAGRGLVGMETLRRDGVVRWEAILDRKAAVASQLDADWFIHADPDERRCSPEAGLTLTEALDKTDAAGFNAVNFIEYTFVPTIEQPDHDHPGFETTMRRYYPYVPVFPHRLNAWKRQRNTVDLSGMGGHRVRFEGIRPYPISFPMRHYLFLSVAHAIEKFTRRYAPEELEKGWWLERNELLSEDIVLTPERRLRQYISDAELDPHGWLSRHPLFEPAVWRILLGQPNLRLGEPRAGWRVRPSGSR